MLSIGLVQHVWEEMFSSSFFELPHNSGWYCHLLEEGVRRGWSALLNPA